LHIRWPDPALEQEARLMNHKWYAALAYVRANRLNHTTVLSSAHDRFGIMASGKAFNDTRQALPILGWTLLPVSVSVFACTRFRSSGHWNPA
jgi:indolepyruvate ferredoxin oxidoreductase